MEKQKINAINRLKSNGYIPDYKDEMAATTEGSTTNYISISKDQIRKAGQKIRSNKCNNRTQVIIPSKVDGKFAQIKSSNSKIMGMLKNS